MIRPGRRTAGRWCCRDRLGREAASLGDEIAATASGGTIGRAYRVGRPDGAEIHNELPLVATL